MDKKRRRGLAAVFALIFTFALLAAPAWAWQPAELEGFLDYGTDKNNNGVFDHLSADVTMNVNEPGRYKIDGELLVRKNLKEFETIAYASFVYSLEKGLQTVPLHFPGWEIIKKQKDGPYFLNVILIKGSWKNGGPLGETRLFKVTEFEDADEVITTGKVTRKSQALALAEAKAQELNLRLGPLQSLTFNGEWQLSFTNPSSKEPFRFLIESSGEIKYLGAPPSPAGAPPTEPQPGEQPQEPARELNPPGQQSPNAVEETPSAADESTQGAVEKQELAKGDSPDQAPAGDGKGPSTGSREEKVGKLDKPGGVKVWPFVLGGFVLFLILGFASEIKARFR